MATAAFAGFAAVLLPLGSSSSADANGVVRTSHVSLLSGDGPHVLIVGAIPVALVAIPLMFHGATASGRARVVIVVLLGVLVVLGVMTIGLFFVPTWIAMLMSMSAQPETGPVPSSSSYPGS